MQKLKNSLRGENSSLYIGILCSMLCLFYTSNLFESLKLSKATLERLMNKEQCGNDKGEENVTE